MNLLLLSNSSSDAGYLTHALPWIHDWAAAQPHAGEALLLPFAGVTRGWDDYETLVADALAPLGLKVRSLHHEADPAAAVNAVDAARLILVGGGNTFALLGHMRSRGLIGAIAERVRSGKAAYLGWSAGSNVACPTIQTTNDMPVADPGGFDAMGLLPFQINAHYTEMHPPGHRGETRRQRLREFTVLHPRMPVLGLPEGCGLRVHGDDASLLGDLPSRLFIGDQEPALLNAGPFAFPAGPQQR